MRVLVVDDDPICRQAYSRMLRAEGASVEAAASAREALALFYSTRPHVLLSDLVMPGEDGCWLMSRVVADFEDAERRPRGIVVTGVSDRREWARCIAAGFDAFLPKPVNPTVLVDTIARLARDAPN